MARISFSRPASYSATIRSVVGSGLRPRSSHLRMRKTKKINIREFSRNIYSHIKDLPVVVYNKKSGETVFIVISKEEGGVKYELSTEDIIQSNR